MATRENVPAKGAPGKLTAAQLKRMAMPHAELISAMTAAAGPALPPHLGHPQAVVIVCACANTSPTNLGRTLDQLGINGISFRKCVFDDVEHAGYHIDIDAIPAAGTTKLIDVVNVIQNAPRKSP